jgi:hypothetical protein
MQRLAEKPFTHGAVAASIGLFLEAGTRSDVKTEAHGDLTTCRVDAAYFACNSLPFGKRAAK